MNVPRKFSVAFDEEDEMAEVAGAILARCHHVLTGMEIMMLDKIAGMAEPDWDSFTLTVGQIQWFYSLQVQFAAEIGKWRDHK